MTNKRRYLNNRIAYNRSKGQGLIEFALISLLLFMLFFGILEMGRMMFVWSQLASAAQEGARYGVTHPMEVIDADADQGQAYAGSAHNPPLAFCFAGPPPPTSGPCNIVAQARARMVLINPQNVQITVFYDNGAGTRVDPWNGALYNSCVPPHFNVGSDRVVVTAIYQFHFVVGILDNILPANGLQLQMVAARTVENNETVLPTTDCTYNPGGG